MLITYSRSNVDERNETIKTYETFLRIATIWGSSKSTASLYPAGVGNYWTSQRTAISKQFQYS